MKPKQALPIRVRVNLGVMEMKRYLQNWSITFRWSLVSCPWSLFCVCVCVCVCVCARAWGSYLFAEGTVNLFLISSTGWWTLIFYWIYCHFSFYQTKGVVILIISRKWLFEIFVLIHLNIFPEVDILKFQWRSLSNGYSHGKWAWKPGGGWVNIYTIISNQTEVLERNASIFGWVHRCYTLILTEDKMLKKKKKKKGKKEREKLLCSLNRWIYHSSSNYVSCHIIMLWDIAMRGMKTYTQNQHKRNESSKYLLNPFAMSSMRHRVNI